MAIGTVYAALPAAAAAIGFYLYDRNHSISKEQNGATATSNWIVIEKVKKHPRFLPNPKMAPQFDGLHSFETLVGS